MKNLCFNFSNLGYIYLATADDSEESSIVSSFVDAWSDEGVLDEISEQTGTTFKYVMAGPKPVIILDNVLNCIDLTPVVSIIQEKHDSFKNDDIRTLAKLLTAKVGVNFTDGEDGDAQDFINVVVEFTERLNQSSDNYIYKYLSSKFPAEDAVKAIVEKNSVGRNKNYAVGVKNETLYMNNPEAEVFIRIPSEEELRLYYREGVIELPPKAAVIKDYKYPECNTRAYKRYCQGDPILLKEVQGDPDNNINVNEGKVGVTATNTLDENGIFPNELNYYKSICNLMDATSEALVEVKKLREETIEKNKAKEEADLQAYYEAKRLAEEKADEAEAKARKEMNQLIEARAKERMRGSQESGTYERFDRQAEEREIIEQVRALANTTVIVKPKYPKTDKDFLAMDPISSEDEFYRSVRYYICHLIERAAVFNWSHTGNVTIYRASVDDGEDDNDSDDDDVTSSRRRYAEVGDLKLDSIDSLEIIYAVYDYLIQVDPHSVAEFLIKMLRWGSRKPTKIIFSSDNVEKEFDLSRFILTNRTFGYANSEKIVRDGVEFYYVGYITTTSMFKCAAYFNEVGATTTGVPIGIVTLRYFKTPKGEQIAQQVYMSLLDVLEILDKHPNKIHGITLNQDGTIKVTAPENEAKMTIDIAIKNAIDSAASDQRFKIYESKRVLQLALQFGLKNISNVLYLSLIKDLLFNSRLNLIIEDKNFHTLQEGKNLCKVNDVNTVVMGKIGNEIILKFANILHEASLEPEFNIEDALNYAKSIFNNVGEPFIAEKGTTGTASAMKALTQKMNIGGDNKKMNVREVMLNYLLDDVNKCIQYRRLTHDGEIICYIGVYKGEDGALHYVLTTKEEFKGNAKDGSEFLVMAQRIASQLIALPVMDESKYNLLYYKFSSEKAIQEFYHAFKRIPLV